MKIMGKIPDAFVDYIHNDMSYPRKVPFNPPESLPEITYTYSLSKENQVYQAIRELFVKQNIPKKTPSFKFTLPPTWRKK